MEYSTDELTALPQTDMVFDAPVMIADQHVWQQEGYYITDACNPSRLDCQHVGIPIGNGKMLIKDTGAYRIVDELTRI